MFSNQATSSRDSDTLRPAALQVEDTVHAKPSSIQSASSSSIGGFSINSSINRRPFPQSTGLSIKGFGVQPTDHNKGHVFYPKWMVRVPDFHLYDERFLTF